MTLRYRTTGDWGAGLGANLSAAQVDENFWTLAEQIAGWSAPTGVGVASITVAGINMTIHLTDGTTQGPFVLPFATFSYEGDWVAGTSYAVMSLFYVTDVGLYLVIDDGYVAPTDFDGGDAKLKLVIGVPPLPDNSALIVGEEDTEFHLLVEGDAGHYIRIDQTGATTVDGNIQIGVPQDPAFAEGYWVTFRQVGTRQLEFVAEGTSVNINTPETLLSRKQGSTVTIVYLGFNQWDLGGDLQVAP